MRAVVCLGILCFGLGRASAQPSDAELGDVATFLDLFPETRQLPAPAFLQPGLRVSYQSAAAIIGGGGAGAGVIQYDVLASVGSQVVARAQTYADNGQGPQPVSSTSARGLPGLGPFWINPRALANAERFNGGQLTVTRFDKDLADGRTATVVRFQTQTANGRTVFEFDATTGLLVFNSLTAGAQEAQLTYLGARTVTAPWPPGRAPNWVRPQAAVQYRGTRTTTVAGGGAGQQAVEVGIGVVEAGARWSVSLVSLSLDGMNQGQVPAATGHRGVVGGLWLPVSALAQGPPAQPARIDTDPITGAETWFSTSPDGTIDIEERTAASVTRNAYHPQLGVLQRSAQQLNLGNAVVETQVARVTADADLEALAAQPPLAEDPVTGAGGGGGAGGAGGGGGAAGEGGAGGAGGGGAGGGGAGEGGAGGGGAGGGSAGGGGAGGGGGGGGAGGSNADADGGAGPTRVGDGGGDGGCNGAPGPGGWWGVLLLGLRRRRGRPAAGSQAEASRG